ncbi:MAG TPA: DinB family protein [Candidatus Sulfopaludibacter sp.]|nr:DinB family protein [Candidatus Sulfopaludibacter sp.]
MSGFLLETIERELPNLRLLTGDQTEVPRAPGKWSPKEELGHLVDSAANNHVRFVGCAGAPEYRGPGYAQEDWVRMHGYRAMAWDEIVEFWYRYNRLLARLIAAIPEGSMANTCTVSNYAPVTLAELIEDYVVHMQHHIDQLLLRDPVTKFPR